MGVSITDPLYGPIFEDANVLLRGAAEGQGAIIGWLPLIDQDLAEKKVVRIFDENIPPTHGYFIEVQHSSRARSEVKKVQDWLITQS